VLFRYPITASSHQAREEILFGSSPARLRSQMTTDVSRLAGG
jgi:hypothetical protein